MKFRQLLEELNELAKEFPESLDMECVYSIDDEGNAYHKVGWTGNMGIHEHRDEFTPSDQLDENERSWSELNAVCIN